MGRRRSEAALGAAALAFALGSAVAAAGQDAPAEGETPAGGAEPGEGEAEPGEGEAEPGEGEAEPGEGDAPAFGTQEASDPPTWRWQQVLASPRIGGRLTAVTVDPDNPQRIFVGTQEGTILRTIDGGITWRELELAPFVAHARTQRPRTPGLPRLGQVAPPTLNVFVDPPERPRPSDRVTLAFDTLWFSLRPDFVFAGFLPPALRVPQPLLDDAVRPQPTSPVRAIAVCPAAEFPLVVATNREVLGSFDGGLTYVRLMRVPGRVSVNWVTCDPADPRDIIVATGFGMFRSQDGGVLFDQAPPEGGKHILVAHGTQLFAGDPESDEGLRMVYPDFNNAETAPWTNIRWIETTESSIFLGTEDGLRASFDGGTRWENIAPNLFSRQQVGQVVVGANEEGGERIAVLTRECTRRWRRGMMATSPDAGGCRLSHVYASDDGGTTWHPFFDGATRRTLQMIAAAPAAPGVPPRWWVVTGGELWATVSPQLERIGSPDMETAAWAREQLRRTPPLSNVIDFMLHNNDLTTEQIQDAVGTIRDRNWLPRINVEATYSNSEEPFSEAVTPINPVFTDGTRRMDEFQIWVYATWYLRDASVVYEELGPTRRRLYELRRQLAFIAEDAWHERKLHLERLARGMTDPLEVEVLRERIAALEAVLEVWMGRPLVPARGENR